MTTDNTTPAVGAADTAAPKSVFASKTVWLALFAALIPLLQGCHVKLFTGDDAEQLATGIAALVGLVLTVIARVNTTPVTVPGASGAAAPVMLFAALLGAAGPGLSGCNLTPAQQQEAISIGWGLVQTAVQVGLAVAGKEYPQIATAIPALESAVNTAASDPAATEASIAQALTAAANTNISDPTLRARTIAAVKNSLNASTNTPAAGPDAESAARCKRVAALL